METELNEQKIFFLTIKLDAVEKQVLSNMLQNPRHEHEDLMCKNLREAIWNALNTVQEA